MGMKTIYNCDICRDECKISDLLGVRFDSLKEFHISHPNKTEGVHICLSCAKQLKKELNKKEDI